jgi:flagellin
MVCVGHTSREAGRKRKKEKQMISLQTNVTSLLAQQNLNADNSFQSKTIAQLTSGYRINSSGDDAAGLAVANGYRSNIAELNQGVSNANDGTSQLQIIDGGLNNISTILDRLKTLATQSASNTFTGSRATLNQEYSNLLKEVDRQAANINLNSGGTFNNNLSVYIGGAATQANASISIDLSGSASAVDSASLGLGSSNVLGGGVGFTGAGALNNTQRIDAPGGAFVKGSAGTDDQTFTFNVFANGSSQTVTATVAASTAGTSLSNVLSGLNGQLNKYGITAGTDSNGLLQFSGATAFTVKDNGTLGAGTSLITNDTAGTAENTSNYIVDGQATYAGVAQTLKFQTSGGATSVALLATDSIAAAISKINAATAGQGVFAVANAAGTGISFQGTNSFSVNASAGSGVFAAAGYNTAAAPVAGTTSNASSAITAIDNAIQALGLVQGRVGAGQNKLQYASSLAQSQISSFSAAESQIRDANVAQQAANLTKAQVLTQTSVAALAQANSAPQSILKLLQ